MQKIQPRSNVTVDDRRAILPVANARKPHEVKETRHEDFIRRALKARLGWAANQAAPQAVLDAAKQMAAVLEARDAAAAAKAEAEAAKAEAEAAKAEAEAAMAEAAKA
jgi:hypothetical protein